MDKKNIPTMQDVVNRLEVLEEERAILQTLYRYGHYIDYGLPEWVDLFTEDAVYEARFREGLGRANYRKEGREALAEYIAAHAKPPAKYSKSLLGAPMITLKSKHEATAVSFFARVEDIGGKGYVSIFGRYLDRLVKQDGRWLFKERIIEVENMMAEAPLGSAASYSPRR